LSIELSQVSILVMASLRSIVHRCALLKSPCRILAGQRGYATLLVADHNNKVLDKATTQAVTAASKLPGSDKLEVLVLGKGCGSVAEEAAKIAGVSKVILAESDQLEHPVADVTSELLLALQKANGYSAIAGVSSSLSKETLPRVAAKLDVQPITDIVDVGSEDGIFTRPMYAGNALATVKSLDSIRIMTFRPTAFEPAPESSSAASVESMAASVYDSAGIAWIADKVSESDKPQLSSANRVVSGGRGLKNGENFTTVLEPLCDKLNAAMGASRAAVDAGFVPNELQVGQTGKVVAPDLYVAVGISGAIQHLAGMKDSKTIVAINKDADAPIFQVADYGLVGDLFEKVPELTGKV
jgi:electron transfer flavoprotein alpha subunit